jgi:hypothetical protein
MGQNNLRFLAPLLAVALAVPPFAMAEDTAAVPVQATHLVGIQSLKSGARAKFTVQGGALTFVGKTASGDIKASSIEDIYTATEATQAGGNVGSAAKAGAIAAPYGAGAALTLILWTKVDLLTILYRGEEGGLHSVLLAMPKGKAEPIRAQLIAAGAHTTERKN